MNGWIGCVLIPHFAAEVERLHDPLLRTAPVIVYSADKVYGVCEASTRAGVEIGMPLRRARALCPEARLVAASPSRYHFAFGQVLNVLCQFTHRIDPGDLPIGNKVRGSRKKPATLVTEPAVWYVDFEKLHAMATKTLVDQILYQLHEETGLMASIGLAQGKFPARIAAGVAAPGTQHSIPKGQEAAFLAPLPVTVLALDEEISRRLRLLGLATLEQLAGIPASALSMQFGKVGTLLHDLAQGQDSRPFIPYRPGATARASHQFEASVSDTQVISALFQHLAGDLSARLHREGYMTRSVQLIVQVEGSRPRERKSMLRHPVNSAEQLSRTLNQLFAQMKMRTGVIAVEVLLADLVPAVGQQLNLFTHQTGQETQLRSALKDVVARYGAECFYWITPAPVKARLPERCYQMQHIDIL